MAATLINPPAELSFAEDPIYVDIETDEITSGVPDQDNLLAYLEVWNNFGTIKFISLHSPYDLTTKETTFDISKAFNLKPAVPTASTIEWNGGIALNAAPDAWIEYYILFADKYGVPPEPEALTPASSFFALYGAQSLDKRGTWNDPTDNVLLCHNYLTRAGEEFVKPISTEQPDWIYIWVKEAINFKIDVLLQKTDGTTQVETLSNDIPITSPGLYYIESGYNQNNLQSVVPADEVTGYQFKILPKTIGTETIVSYQFDCDCHTWPFYLLAFNGLGGCESIYLKGKFSETLESTRSDFQRTRWKDFDIEDGLYGQYNQKGQRTFVVNTGFYPEYYIEHLQSILLGDLWTIDLSNTRFTKAIIDTNSFKIKESDQQMFSLEFKIRNAWLDNYFTLY